VVALQKLFPLVIEVVEHFIPQAGIFRGHGGFLERNERRSADSVNGFDVVLAAIGHTVASDAGTNGCLVKRTNTPGCARSAKARIGTGPRANRASKVVAPCKWGWRR
jgi:hypothetical protein